MRRALVPARGLAHAPPGAAGGCRQPPAAADAARRPLRATPAAAAQEPGMTPDEEVLYGELLLSQRASSIARCPALQHTAAAAAKSRRCVQSEAPAPSAAFGVKSSTV
jgi:hypothetical protein